VQGIPILRLAITQGEVNSYGQIYFTAAENVFKETVSLLDPGVLKNELAVLTFDDWQTKRSHVLFQVVDIEQHAANILVAAVLHGYEELELDVPFDIASAHILLHQNDLVELEQELLPVGGLGLDF